MGYRTILAHVDASKSATGSLRVATDLAQRFEAHLVGLHVRRRFDAPMVSDATMALEMLYKSYEKAAKADEDAAAGAFKSTIGSQAASSEWRAVDGFAEDALVAHARCADLVVIGQPDPDGPPAATPADLIEKFTLSSERPLLIVPHIGASKPVGRKIVLCWNGRREAARAATGALPLLQKAQSVMVLAVDPEADEATVGEPGADVAGWLGRHDVKVTVQRDTAGDTNVANVILSRAADHDADLIVMGLYGHSRMRELVLGGVSRTILSSMTVPILVAH